MKNIDKQLNDLTEIKKLMEKSSKFLSLSGLSGIFIGLYAVTGALFAYYYLRMQNIALPYLNKSSDLSDKLFVLAIDALSVLFLSILTAYILSKQKSKKIKDRFNKLAKLTILNLLIPLVTGGVLCFIMAIKGYFGFIAPFMLIFYGLSLINASKYTLNDIRVLGLLEILLGLFSAYFIGYGLLFWVLGFGILHIIYGIIMYLKYEYKK